MTLLFSSDGQDRVQHMALLLFLIGSFAPGMAPAIDAPTAEWTAYLEYNRAAILLGAVLTVTSVPLLLVVLAVPAARGADALDPSTVTFAIDVAHLSLWGLSAGPASDERGDGSTRAMNSAGYGGAGRPKSHP